MKCDECGRLMQKIAETRTEQTDLLVAEYWQCPDDGFHVWIDTRPILTPQKGTK